MVGLAVRFAPQANRHATGQTLAAMGTSHLPMPTTSAQEASCLSDTRLSSASLRSTQGAVGTREGGRDGRAVDGCTVGTVDGGSVGAGVVGDCEGVPLGTVGMNVGGSVGMGDGATVGCCVVGAIVGHDLQVTGHTAETSALLQPYPKLVAIGIEALQVVIMAEYISGRPAAFAAALSCAVVPSVHAARS